MPVPQWTDERGRRKYNTYSIVSLFEDHTGMLFMFLLEA